MCVFYTINVLSQLCLMMIYVNDRKLELTQQWYCSLVQYYDSYCGDCFLMGREERAKQLAVLQQTGGVSVNRTRRCPNINTK